MLAIVLLCLSRVPAYAQIAFAMNARRAFSLMCGLPHTTENRPFTLLGAAVHIGARVMLHARPNEVLVSSTVKDLVAGSGIYLESLGVRALKVGGRIRTRVWRQKGHTFSLNKVAACQSARPILNRLTIRPGVDRDSSFGDDNYAPESKSRFVQSQP
jgi:hypothetical protein